MLPLYLLAYLTVVILGILCTCTAGISLLCLLICKIFLINSTSFNDFILGSNVNTGVAKLQSRKV